MTAVMQTTRRRTYSNEAQREYISQLKGKGSPSSITEHTIPALIQVLGSQPAGNES